LITNIDTIEVLVAAEPLPAVLVDLDIFDQNALALAQAAEEVHSVSIVRLTVIREARPCAWQPNLSVCPN